MVLNDRRRDIGRINEIVHVLIKHGFESFAGYISTRSSKLPFLNRNISEEIPSDANVRLRFVLEELGTTFIKLGQTLSTYPELIGFDLADELSLLQESAPVDDYETVKKIVEKEFSKPIDEIFDEFSEEPIASASIGQVHTAFLDNNYVAVKVQHPGIKKTVKSDIRIMKIIANRLDNSLDIAKSYNLPGLVEVFERDIKKELDYKFEAMNAIHLYDLLKDDEVYVPKVYKEYTTSKVLTMEYVDGVSLNTVLSSNDDKYDKEKIAMEGADSFIKQVLEYGFYHADPHPGNIFVLENSSVAFVDFGMMGHLDDDLREDLAKLFIFISEGDAKLLTKQLMYMGIVDDSNDYKDIEYEILQLLDRYYGIQFNDISGVLRGLIEDDLLNEYGVVLPRDLMMVIRTLSMVDDVGRSLCPDFNTTEIVKPYALKMLVDTVKPKRLFSKSTATIMDIQNLSKKLPDSLLNFFSVVEDGHLNIALASHEIDIISAMISRIVNELVLAIIIAALLVGSSLIMDIDSGIQVLGYSILGFIGFIVSGIFGIVLMVLIIRGGNY
ncbi:MAG TPA: AarF/ABC1/UbiB kinase family protein [Methanosphaera sp.]|nr:AarF/ABC1/UbiB kinase family protein [Methanosphaera sp.]HIJ16117.1 AarF/ABC1/UbiB kinase family protein [Methanosphaera sp.]